MNAKAGRPAPRHAGNIEDKHRLLSLWLTGPEGRAALAGQRHLWHLLTKDARRQRVVLVESPAAPWCSFIKEQGFLLTVSPEPLEGYGPAGGGGEQACNLPFSDDEFDLAALLGGLEYLRNPAQALIEAARISRRGVVIITRNGAWPARFLALTRNSLGRVKWPPLENWFTAGSLERLIRGIFVLRNFRLTGTGPAFFLKGPWFNHWLGCYFSPAYTMVADGLFLTDQPLSRTAEGLNPATTSRQFKFAPPAAGGWNSVFCRGKSRP